MRDFTLSYIPFRTLMKTVHTSSKSTFCSNNACYLPTDILQKKSIQLLARDNSNFLNYNTFISICYTYILIPEFASYPYKMWQYKRAKWIIKLIGNASYYCAPIFAHYLAVSVFPGYLVWFSSMNVALVCYFSHRFKFYAYVVLVIHRLDIRYLVHEISVWAGVPWGSIVAIL